MYVCTHIRLWDGVLTLDSESLSPSKNNWWHSGFWTVWDGRSFGRGLDKWNKELRIIEVEQRNHVTDGDSSPQ